MDTTKTILLSLAGVLFLYSCGKETDLYEPDKVKPVVNTPSTPSTPSTSTAAQFPGTIDANQDWCPVTCSSVSITADAELSDIVKVQILTESPFFNPDSKVLNEIEARKGQTVTLQYDAPSVCTQLVAACVNSKGIYYIQVFNVGDQTVSFASQANYTRAANEDETPNPSAIQLAYSNSYPTFNALRAQQEGTLIIKDNKNTPREYTEWQNSSWANERHWSPTNASLGGWTIADGSIYRPAAELTAAEEANIRAICDTYLVKNGSGTDATNGKRNNWKRILDGQYFTVNNNYLVSNGTPVTLIPVQLNSSEVSYNSIYYYYYDPAQVAGMSDAEQTAFLQALPKYKAISGSQARNAANKQGKGLADYFRVNEYLLPYYGDGTPGEEGTTAVSCVIPKGYKIGFMNRKRMNGNYDYYKNGCTYGDGRLNYAVNHLAGHYLSAMDKTLGGSTEQGMDFTSPRIAVFSANNSTYMCFEDGADCNFCDMIVEVTQGVELIEEPEKPEAAAYTMCFEDRPATADYDMNDVVLQAARINATHIQIALVACGAQDRVKLHGIQGSRYLNDQEIHSLFGLDEDQYFVNTQANGLHLNAVSEVITVDASVHMEDFLRAIYIENVTTNSTIGMPYPGQEPFAIIVPENFKYPLEKISIVKAYPDFLKWAQNMNDNQDWYAGGLADKLFPDLIVKW